jgi:hypothetical protein
MWSHDHQDPNRSDRQKAMHAAGDAQLLDAATSSQFDAEEWR